MPRFRLDDKRTEPIPDRRLGIKLETPPSKKRLKGKVDDYVPPELRYEYKPPSVFVRYRGLTVAFVSLFVAVSCYWAYLVRHTPAPAAPTIPNKPISSSPQPASEQPIYIEPLPAK